MVKLSDRPHSDLDALADRIADVLNSFAGRLPIKPEDVDLRTVAEFCWALDVTTAIEFKLLALADGGRDAN